jgi:hypothetical protein
MECRPIGIRNEDSRITAGRPFRPLHCALCDARNLNKILKNTPNFYVMLRMQKKQIISNLFQRLSL